MNGTRGSTAAASAALLGLAGLHAAWGAGATWPLADRAALADAVMGTGEMPPPAACFAVAGALAGAAAFVGGWPRQPRQIHRWGAGGVVGVLTARGVLGLLDSTNLISRSSSSERFRGLDRRFYSPLCLGLAALSVPAIGRG